jgi:gliding motility-associated-like protein
MNALPHHPVRGRRAPLCLAILLAVFSLFSAVRSNAQGAVVCPPNIDFSYGNTAIWQCYTGTSIAGPAGAAIFGSPVFSGPISGRHTATSGPGLDPYGGFPVVAPGGGISSLKLGDSLNGAMAERVRYYVHVPVGFNNYSFSFRYAVVFESPDDISHQPNEKPSMQIKAFDSATGLEISKGCAWQTFVASDTQAGFFTSTVMPFPRYRPWTNGTLNLSGQGGRTIIVEVSTYDCTLGGHFGYGYFDVISCGQFQAALTNCDLDKGIVTMEAPAGYVAYKWYRGAVTGAPFSLTRTTTLPTVPTTPTYYYCVLTPASGPACNDTIRTKPISDFRMDATPDQACNSLGKPLQLGVTASGGVNDFSYAWTAHPILSPGPDPLSGKLNPPTVNGSVTAAPFGTTNLICTVTDSVGCFRRDTVRIQNPSFRINLGPDITTCLHTPVNLRPTLTPPGPGYIFTWNTRRNLNDSTTLNVQYTPVKTGNETYILRVDSGVCATADTIMIRTLPDTFSVADTAVCERAIFNARVQGDPQYHDLFTYTWSPSTYVALMPGNNRTPSIQPDTSITYAVTMSYPGCPDIKRSLSVRVEPVPRVNIGPDTIAKCFEKPLDLTADVTPVWYSNYTYSWKANDFLDNTNTSMVRFTGEVDTTLIVTVQTPLGCKGVDSIRVKALAGGFGGVNTHDTAICPKNNIHLAASGGVSYRWSPGLYLSDSTASNVTAHPETSVNYTLYVTDRNGCVDTLPVAVQVYSAATVSLPDSAVLYPGESMTMDPQGNGFYFDWFPTLGLSNPGIANPIAEPKVNTRYFVTATTEGGCTATDSIYVIVHQQSAIEMPNAFVPGTGANNMFRVARQGIASLKSFRVYNRWGTLMFETRDINKGWDGRYNDQPQPMGVYVYTVEATGVEGQTLSKSGNVTLIR